MTAGITTLTAASLPRMYVVAASDTVCHFHLTPHGGAETLRTRGPRFGNELAESGSLYRDIQQLPLDSFAARVARPGGTVFREPAVLGTDYTRTARGTALVVSIRRVENEGGL